MVEKVVTRAPWTRTCPLREPTCSCQFVMVEPRCRMVVMQLCGEACSPFTYYHVLFKRLSGSWQPFWAVSGFVNMKRHMLRHVYTCIESEGELP